MRPEERDRVFVNVVGDTRGVGHPRPFCELILGLVIERAYFRLDI